jgi:hypothetical protein
VGGDALIWVVGEASSAWGDHPLDVAPTEGSGKPLVRGAFPADDASATKRCLGDEEAEQIAERGN